MRWIAVFAPIFLMSQAVLAKDVIADASLFTVKISSAIDYPFGQERKGTGRGSGFLVDRERGWILTNAHVVGRSPSTLKVSFKNHPYMKAEKVYLDNHLDIAVIKVDPGRIPPESMNAIMQCRDDLRPGEAVIAFGHPWNLDYTATRGIVSGTTVADGVEALQTDAALNPGNSGGPLIDQKSGTIIGVNSSRLGGDKSQGMNFAIPIKLVCTIVNLLKDGRDPAPPILPLSFATTIKDGELVVGEVKKEWREILKIGDRILAVDGDHSARYASRIMDHMRGKDHVNLLISRNERDQEIKIDVPTRKDWVRRLGVQVSGMTVGGSTVPEKDPTEMCVQFVNDASVAEQAQFREADIVLSINGVETKSHDGVLKSLEGQVGAEVEIVIKRERQPVGNGRFDYFARKLDVNDVFVVDESGAGNK